MEATSQSEIGSQSLVIRIFCGLACMVGLMSTSPLAHAQLRSGRGTRVLYQDDLHSQQQARGHRGNSAQRGTPQTARANRGDRAQVRRAAYQETETIIEQPAALHTTAPEPLPMHEGCSGCSSCSGSSCDGLPGYSDCGGCGGGNCGGKCLAPCASSFRSGNSCFSDCSLASLWCRLKIRAEVPLYWRRDQGPPSLVTTSPEGTSADVAGRLGEPTTSILFGNGTIFDKATAGIRVTLSTWLDNTECHGLTFRYWNAGKLDDITNFDSSDFSILARPFFNTTVEGNFEQDAQLIAFTGESVGRIQVGNESMVDGLELSLRHQLYRDRFNRFEWMWGYQHVRIDEGLTISSNTIVTGGLPGLQGTAIDVLDRFETRNDFHGFHYGLTNTRRFACWRLETLFRLGMGNLRRKVNIGGVTTTTSNGVSNTENQGLMARNTNSGSFSDDTFIVIPEVGVNVAYRICSNIDFNVGYNYMLVPKVAQAAQQMDDQLAVNLSDPLVGALDPSFDFDERKYWIHSLGLGLQMRY